MPNSKRPWGDILPMDILTVIKNYLPSSAQVRFERTCKKLYHNSQVINPVTHKRYSPALFQVMNNTNQLLQLIKSNEVSKVKSLINQDPGLLFEKGKINGIEITPYELAFKERNPDMCKVIWVWVKLSEFSNETKAKLLNRIKEIYTSPLPFYDLKSVFNAINSQKNPNAAINKFRNDLRKLVNEQGFPIQTLIDAYHLYKKRNYMYAIPTEFSIYVLGFLQQAPVWIKKIIERGFLKSTDNSRLIF